jgi:short-subunit dehydrogenase
VEHCECAIALERHCAVAPRYDRRVAFELSGARVLLTGASGGIGNAIARALHERGASLAITGRRADALEALQAELGERVDVLQADLSERADVEALPGRAGAVDVLVANAGLPGSGRLDSFSPAEIDRAIEVNLRAPMQLARALVPAMLERGRGHVVLVSSLSGKVAAGGASVYSATKFGLRGFGMSLHDELHGTGVGVTTVFPGFISDAGMFADADVKLPPGVGMKSPEQVAAGVIQGIERNRAEIDVAPLSLRASGWLAGAAPAAVAAMGRRLGAGGIAKGLAEGQRDKR